MIKWHNSTRQRFRGEEKREKMAARDVALQGDQKGGGEC